MEADGLGLLKVPADELQITVFGRPFATAALRVIGWPMSTVLGLLE
jgi:hypothetical protein